MTKDYVKLIDKANMLTGVGLLLTVVPLGMCIVSYITADGASPVEQLRVLGWAASVTLMLLPLGFLIFSLSLGWMVILKREQKRSELAGDNDEDDGEGGILR